MSGWRWQRAPGCALQDDGVQTKTLELDTRGPRQQLRKTLITDYDTAGAAHPFYTFQTRMMCVCQADLSTVRGSYAVQTYREGSKKASMLEKTILDSTPLLKHGTLSPESLHAESQWDRPQRGRPGGSQVRAV